MLSNFWRRRIYMDYASAPPISSAAAKAMRDAETYVGNPGALHHEAVEAKKKLEEARESIASDLACKARQIIFTSGLTEANTLAIVGYARALERIKRTLAGTHWIVSAIEHPSVLEAFAEVERLGGKVTQLKPDQHGVIQVALLQKELRPETVLVSIGWANHEIGTLQPLSDISHALRAHEQKHSSHVLLHSDAGQAPLYKFPHVHTLSVDMLSLGANKLYGPHGIGALYVADRVQLAPLLSGGGQERALRAGTENVALAAGFAAAMFELRSIREHEAKRLAGLRDALWHTISHTISGIVRNGSEKALPHLLNVSVPGVDSEYIALALDREGIALSTKSACSEGEAASHVVLAISDDMPRARSTFRFSLGTATRASDISRVAEMLTKHVELFRRREVV